MSHGIHKEWYKNGQLKYKDHYKNDMKHGICKKWNKYGELQEICFYSNDACVKKLHEAQRFLDLFARIEYLKSISF